MTRLGLTQLDDVGYSSPGEGPWPRVVAVVGPTASGKSEVALDLAVALGGEVVNADAFQIYRGLDIGTAKLNLDQRRGITHHMVDEAGFTQDVTAAWYQRRGRAVLAGLASVGRPAIVAGGSGLFIRGLLDDLRFPGTDSQVRAKWEQQLALSGPEKLHAVLAQVDPSAAAAILPGNGRRIVRALEVCELTGQSFQANLPKSGPPLVPHISVGLLPDLQTLDRQIAARVGAMIAQGFRDEVEQLVARGFGPTLPAAKAIGYQQMMAHLRGELTLDEVIGEMVTATRRYARRQMRWFRADARVTWFETLDWSSTGERILAHVQADRG